MPLKPDEIPQVIADLRAYPKGVPSDAWGFGPLAELDEESEYFPAPEDFDRKTLLECG